MLQSWRWLAFTSLALILTAMVALWRGRVGNDHIQQPRWCDCYLTTADCKNDVTNWPEAACVSSTDAGATCLKRPGHFRMWSTGVPKDEDTGLDGLCYTPPFRVGPFPKPELLVKGVGAWFDAYLGSAKKGTRLTLDDRELLHSEMSRMGLRAPYPRHVKMVVDAALDVTLGWDFSQDRTEPYLASLMKPRPSAIEIADATRTGIEQSILQNDAGRLQPALHAFWIKHPDFVPMHQGRCYAHGHSWVTNPDEQEACQVNEIASLLKVLLGIGTK